MNRTGWTQLFATALVAGLLSTGAARASDFQPSPKGEVTDSISVPEMQCGMCEHTVEKAVGKLKGISSVSADAESDVVIVTYNPKAIARDTIERAIADAGYTAGKAMTTPEAQSKLSACCRPPSHEE